MTNKPLLGELLVQQELVSRDTIDAALRVQVGGNRRLGHILVRMKAISADQLAEILAEQIDTPIVDIAEKFSPDAKKILPRYLCKQYGVLPLSVQPDNIIEVAMANPSDEEAITDLEHFTGKVVAPCLARYSDIEREINKRIPVTFKDFFTPQTGVWSTRLAAGLSLALVLGLGTVTYNYIYKSHYGTVTKTDSQILYNNLDLIVGIDNTGKVSLLGHGAFSEGYYSVSFNNPAILKTFVEKREKDFSAKQLTWLHWAIKKSQTNNLASSVATTTR